MDSISDNGALTARPTATGEKRRTLLNHHPRPRVAANVRAYKVERPVRGEEAGTHMRIVVTNYGGPHALQVFEEGCPEPKDGEVRARVPIAGNIL